MDFNSELLGTFLADSSDAYILFGNSAETLVCELNATALKLFAVTDSQSFSDLFAQGFFDKAGGHRSAPDFSQLLARAFAGHVFSGPVTLSGTGRIPFKADLRLRSLNLDGQTHVLARIRNVLPSQEAEYTLRRWEQKLLALLETTPLGVVISVSGKVVWANTGVEQLTGLKTGDQLISKFVNPEDNETIDQTLSSQRSVVDYALRMYGPSGCVREIYLTAMPLEFGGRQVRLDWLTDISALKETEKALTEAKYAVQAADGAKSDFLARMSHEIRTPMNAILGMCYLCLKTHLTVKQRDYLIKIQDAAQMLMGIINDVLDFSKTNSDSLTLENVPIYLDLLLESISGAYAAKAEKKGLEFLVRIDPKLPKVLLGDALRLSQVLQVLVSNAVKFTERGEVTIRVSLVGQDAQKVQVHFSVKDSGIGMSEDEQAKLFLPFSQGDDYTTRRYGGTGLGLAISKNMVELMGGEIWAESTPGLGSTFHFMLGLGREGIWQPDEQDRQINHNLEILVVDDNSAAASLLADLLEMQNFQCTTADNGRQALLIMEEAAAQGRSFRFVFVDWKMDGLDGIETAHLIQSAFPGEKKPIIVLVSGAMPEFGKEFLQANGISDFLPKPVSSSLLAGIVNRLLDEANQQSVSESAPQPKSAASIRGARILLVEDNEINQEIALSLLQSEGMQVDVAGNGQEALDILNKHDFRYYQLIFMDIQMPIMDGLNAALEIRKLGHGVDILPIVAMTAHARTSDRAKSLEAGMNDHITKPLDPDKLHQTLEAWIDPERVVQPGEAFQESVLREIGVNLRQHFESGDPVSGLSLEAGLESVGGNQALYAKLLRKFRESCYSADVEIRNAIDNADSELAVRLAHTVKGVSASLGMIALSRVAGTAERSLKDLRNLKEIDANLLEEFSQELHNALNAVNLYLGDHGADNQQAEFSQTLAENSIDPDLAAEVIEDLHLLMNNLEMDWGLVMAQHERVVNLLSNYGCRSQVYNLTVAVENFDIPAVMASARTLEDVLLTKNEEHKE